MKKVTVFAIVAIVATLFTGNALAATANGMNAQLYVNDPVVIISGANNQAIELGQTATFTITLAAGVTMPCDYVWRKDGVALTNGGRISGADTATLTITNCVDTDAAGYDCVVNNVVNVPATSAVGMLSFTNQLTVVISSNQPGGATVALNPGTAITFMSSVTGSQGTVTYEWRKGGGAIAGASGNSYTIANVQSGNAGVYTLHVVDQNGPADSNAITLTVNVGITITQQPQNVTVVIGQTGSFSVGINPDATQPVSYQWSKDGNPLVGETGATLTVTNCQPANAGSYRVTITNVVGSVTSDPAVLNVTGSLLVTTTTLPVYVDEAGVATVRINPNGGPAPNAFQYINTVTGGTPPYINPAVTKGGAPATNGTLAVVGSVYTYTVMNADNTDEGLYGFSITDSN